LSQLKSCWFDTEGLGIYSPSVIIQARFDYHTEKHDDKPFIFDLWRNPASQTVALIEEIVTCRVVAHNLTFDWQRVSQFYCAARGLQRDHGIDARPIDHVTDMANLFYSERSAFCLKPPAAVCTLLLCQKQIGGSALATKEIRVRKVPTDVAQHVADMLNGMTDLPEILFAKRASDQRWQTALNDDDETGTQWLDVALRFGPSSALKDIARFVLGVEDIQKIGESFESPPYPYECGYAPYATLLNDGGWEHNFYDKKLDAHVRKPLWPLLLRQHLNFWTASIDAPQTKYALDDVYLLERLDKHLGSLETDFDSEMACQVASVRVAGLPIDMAKLDEQIAASSKYVAKAEINVNSHIAVRKYIAEALDPMEALIVADGCDKEKLKKLTTAMVLEGEEFCCKKGCGRCGGKGTVGPGPMPVVARALHVLSVRKHKKRLQLYDKLMLSKEAFPSFKVIGTKSGRMSGADGLNYHAIDSSNEIRDIFTFAKEGWIVCGGDMNSQELAIAAAVMHDGNLEKDIETGKSLHGVFAAEASQIPYSQIMKNKDDKNTVEAGWYKKAKICVYAILYGAASFNIAHTLGVTPEEAERIILGFFAKYPIMAETRKLVKQSLEALRPDESGRLRVVEPKQQHIDSVFGFRRSFQAEFAVMNILFQGMKQWNEMSKDGTNAPAYMEFLELDRKIVRKENKGTQTVKSAVSSALYGSVFSLQGKILRAALNHLIQSAGRTCTLRVQKRVWDEVQPVGIHEFLIKLLSVHDELATVSEAGYAPIIEKAVADEMAALCRTVPLLSLDWATNVGSWNGVKSAVGSLEGLTEDEASSAVLADRFVRCGWDG